MIGNNTRLTPIIHHFHSNAYISTVEMIGDNPLPALDSLDPVQTPLSVTLRATRSVTLRATLRQGGKD